MKKNILLVFILGVVVGIGVSFAGYKLLGKSERKITRIKNDTDAKPKANDQKQVFSSNIISTFEQQQDLQKWSKNGVELEVVSEHASEGSYSLKVTYPKSGSPGLSAWRTLPSDWRGFNVLKFDIYNPHDEIIKFGIIIRDEISDAYPERYDGYFALASGMNNFELNITGLRTNNKKRMLAMDKIKEMVIYLDKPARPGSLYLDNVRFEKVGISSFAGVELISDFEGKVDYFKWKGKNLKQELSKEHYSQGKQSLKVVFPRAEYPGLNCIIGLPGDWNNFNTLKFDVYNPQQEVVNFGIMIKDYSSGSYAERYDGYFALKPGMNNFELNVTALKTNDKKRTLALDRIEHLTIFLFKPQKEYTLYFDNIRLETENEEKLGKIYRFDFGPETSEIWPGFKQVTNKTKYTKEKGYGWAHTYQLRAEDRRYPDPLFRDWVKGGAPFNIDLANGEYVVYMMLEDPGFWEYYQNYYERQVFAEGKLVLQEFLDSGAFFKQYYFKHQDVEDLPGEDTWEKYVKTRFTPKIFKVRIEDKQLNLEFSPQWGYACTLSTLIIYPVQDEKKGQAYIEDLNRKRKAYFSSHFVENLPKIAELSFRLNAEQERKGYVLFSKNYMDRIRPYTQPEKTDIKEEISIFAAQGESEPFTVGVYPLKDLGICQLRVENLVSPNGNVINADNLKIRVIQYKLKLAGKKVYEVRGELLRKKNQVEVKKGITRQFWVTVNIPEGTPAGNYKGNIYFQPPQAEEQSLSLELAVLPFKLTEPDIALGMFYFFPEYLRWYSDTQNQLWGRIEEQLWDLKEHNINSLAVKVSPKIKNVSADGQVELDFGDFDEFMHRYKHFGFNKPIVGYGMIGLVNQAEKHSQGDEQLFRVILQNTYQALQRHISELYGPEVIFCIADEISNVDGKGAEYGVKIAKIAREVPNIKTVALLNSIKDVPIFPYVDIATINNGMNIDQELINQINKTGSEIWFYNLGRSRFTYGFYLAKTGAQGRIEWNYQLPAVDPYFDLDGREADFCASYPTFDEPINSTWFEWIKEGIDDYKYMLTLSQLIKQVKASSNAQALKRAEAAEKVLQDVVNDVQVELRKNYWAAEEYDQKRWKIAEQIIILKNLLNEGQFVFKQ